MSVLQSFGDIKDEAGVVQYERVQALLRKLVWARACNGIGPALSVEDEAVERVAAIRNDLWRERRVEILASEHPVAWEAMTLEQVLMTWRAIHAGGGSSIDLTVYV